MLVQERDGCTNQLTQSQSENVLQKALFQSSLDEERRKSLETQQINLVLTDKLSSKNDLRSSTIESEESKDKLEVHDSAKDLFVLV